MGGRACDRHGDMPYRDDKNYCADERNPGEVSRLLPYALINYLQTERDEERREQEPE